MTIDTLRMTAEEVNGLLEQREVSSQEIFDAYRTAIDERDGELLGRTGGLGPLGVDEDDDPGHGSPRPIAARSPGW